MLTYWLELPLDMRGCCISLSVISYKSLVPMSSSLVCFVPNLMAWEIWIPTGNIQTVSGHFWEKAMSGNSKHSCGLESPSTLEDRSGLL